MDDQAVRDLLDEFVARVRESLSDSVVSIILYGSVARGNATVDSDIDVLVVLEEAPSVYHERLRPFMPVLRQLRARPGSGVANAGNTQAPISLLVLSRAEANQNRPLYLDMLDDARMLFDRDGFFARRLDILRGRLEELGARKLRRGDRWYWDLKPDLKPDEVLVL